MSDNHTIQLAKITISDLNEAISLQDCKLAVTHNGEILCWYIDGYKINNLIIHCTAKAIANDNDYSTSSCSTDPVCVISNLSIPTNTTVTISDDKLIGKAEIVSTKPSGDVYDINQGLLAPLNRLINKYNNVQIQGPTDEHLFSKTLQLANNCIFTTLDGSRITTTSESISNVISMDIFVNSYKLKVLRVVLDVKQKDTIVPADINYTNGRIRVKSDTKTHIAVSDDSQPVINLPNINGSQRVSVMLEQTLPPSEDYTPAKISICNIQKAETGNVILAKALDVDYSA